MTDTSRECTWTPSPVRCASRSSSASDSPGRGAAAAVHIPFTVTEASPRSLNPTAKSFAPQIPAQGGNGLFAMPSSSSAAVPRAGGEGPSMRREPRLPGTDAMTWAAAVGLGGGSHEQRHRVPAGGSNAYYPASSVGNAGFTVVPLDDAAVLREAEAFVRKTWTPVCVANGLHMVMVMNLAPRTLESDLSRMFFPMGASKVALIDPKDLPLPLAQSLTLGGGGRRRLGVVFFDRKDFAMVGVEKLDNFVPSGQHQPLVVRYCGPDAESTPLSGAPEPHAAGESLWMPSALEREAIQQEMCRVFGHVRPNMTMVAVHGLDPTLAISVLRQSVVPSGAVGCEPWRPRQAAMAPLGHAQCAKYKSISAVAWYPTEEIARAAVHVLDGRVQLGQRQPIHLAVLSSTRVANAQPVPSPHSPATAAVGAVGGGSAAFQERGTSRPMYHASPPQLPPTFNVSLAANGNTSIKSVGPVASVYTDPANTSTEVLEVYDKLDQEFLAAHPDPKLHLVGVHNLIPNTTHDTLFKIFYPMGALNVMVSDTPVVLRDKKRVSGVALFSSKGMAEEAAKKINDFVPHGQSRPLVARYLSRDKTDNATAGARPGHGAANAATPHDLSTDCPGAANDAHQGGGVSAVPTLGLGTQADHFAGVPQGASTPRRPAVSEQLSRSASVSKLLVAVEQHLSTRPLNPEFLASAMTQLAEHPDSAEEEADQLGQLLVDALIAANHHSITLSTPISNVLYQLHENLAIPRRGRDAETDEERDKITFVRGIARAMLSLLVDSRRAREARSVAAVVCAYLFDFCYLGSPYDFAVRNVRKYAKELDEAKSLLAREAGVPTTPEEQAKVSAWVTLMDCLRDLTAQWSNANKALARQDPYVDEFQLALKQFYGTEYQSESGPSTRERRAYCGGISSTPTQTALAGQRSPVASDLLGSASTRRMVPSGTQGEPELVTPSARPTPRRVVARMSPSSATHPLKSQPPKVLTQASGASGVGPTATPGVSGVGADIPHVVLTPFSDRTQGVSTDISLESNYMVSAQAAAAALGVTASSLNESPWQYGRSDNSSCTVYVTKLPSHFTSGQVRRLLTHFGPINKVRLCQDDKENSNSGTAVGAEGERNANKSPYHRLSFGFVEFVESRSAKAMIEYFRNHSQSSTAFNFLLTPPGAAPSPLYLTEEDIQLLRNTRTSKARSPIHDECPLDAELRLMSNASAQPNNAYLRVKPCQFGLLLPNEPIENYSQVCEEALEAAAKHGGGATGVAAASALSSSSAGLLGGFAPAVTPATTNPNTGHPTVSGLFMNPTTTNFSAPQLEQPREGLFDPMQWTMEMNDDSPHFNSSSHIMGDDGDVADAVLREAMDALMAVCPAMENDDE